MRKLAIAGALLVASAFPALAKSHHHHHRHRHLVHHHHHHTRLAKRHHQEETTKPVHTDPPHFIVADIMHALGGVAAEISKAVRHIEVTMGNIAGMNHSFVDKLHTAFAAIPDGHCHVGSGFRSHSEQARLYRAKPGLAARPGHSNHERGLAADLSCSGRALAWLHGHASQFGLNFPMGYEPWHAEPTGLTRLARHHHHERTRLASRHERRVHLARHHRRTHYAAG